MKNNLDVLSLLMCASCFSGVSGVLFAVSWCFFVFCLFVCLFVYGGCWLLHLLSSFFFFFFFFLLLFLFGGGGEQGIIFLQCLGHMH